MGRYALTISTPLAAEPSIDRAVHTLADQILVEAQTLCPVDTGALRSSGFSDGADSAYRVGFGQSAGPIDYAKYVEFGTTHANAQPFLSPAALKSRGTL